MSKCNCIHETDDVLRKRGYKLADACMGFRITEDLRFETQYGLPIVRVDGKRRRRGDPSIVVVEHCPFCGTKISSAPAEVSKQPSNAGALGNTPAKGERS